MKKLIFAMLVSSFLICNSISPSFAAELDLTSLTTFTKDPLKLPEKRCYVLSSDSLLQTPAQIFMNLPPNSYNISMKLIRTSSSVYQDGPYHFFLHGPSSGIVEAQYRFTNDIEASNGNNGIYRFPIWYVSYSSHSGTGTYSTSYAKMDGNEIQKDFCVDLIVNFTPNNQDIPPFTTTSYSTVPQQFYTYDNQFQFHLSKNPDVCEFEPQQTSVLKSLKVDLIQETNNALIDWQSHLSQGYGRDSPWKFTWRVIPISEQNNANHYADCNIIFYYKLLDSPDVQLFFGAAGVTNVDNLRHKAIIEIFYDSSAKTTLYGMSIRHELGHALGLGHYIVSDEELKRVASGAQDYPSIMFPIYNWSNDYSITPVDIRAIHNIYGDSGFILSKADSSPKFQYIPDSIKEIAKAESGDGSLTYPSTARMLLNYMIFDGLIQVPSTYDLTNDKFVLTDNVNSEIIEPWLDHKISDFQFLSLLQNFIDTNKIDSN